MGGDPNIPIIMSQPNLFWTESARLYLLILAPLLLTLEYLHTTFSWSKIYTKYILREGKIVLTRGHNYSRVFIAGGETKAN